MKVYNVGMIGFGFIGKVHAYGHMNIPLYYDQQEFKSRITHICTSRPATAEKGAAQVGGDITPVTDYRQITENPDIDIVDICTPNHLHFEAVMSAIKNGKHIYCDKPLTATLDEALQIREALKTYKGISQMTLQNRFFPVTLRAKQLIDVQARKAFWVYMGERGLSDTGASGRLLQRMELQLFPELTSRYCTHGFCV